MCRSIKTLYNNDPRASDEEVRAAALQFVRKVSGYREPSKVNKSAFDEAVNEISHTVEHLLGNLHTHTAPKKR